MPVGSLLTKEHLADRLYAANAAIGIKCFFRDSGVFFGEMEYNDYTLHLAEGAKIKERSLMLHAVRREAPGAPEGHGPAGARHVICLYLFAAARERGGKQKWI